MGRKWGAKLYNMPSFVDKKECDVYMHLCVCVSIEYLWRTHKKLVMMPLCNGFGVWSWALGARLTFCCRTAMALHQIFFWLHPAQAYSTAKEWRVRDEKMSDQVPPGPTQYFEVFWEPLLLYFCLALGPYFSRSPLCLYPLSSSASVLIIHSLFLEFPHCSTPAQTIL